MHKNIHLPETRAPATPAAELRMYHVTALSNLARAYDIYSRRYDKSRLPRCSFPGQFFLLHAHDLHVGQRKAQALLDKLNLPGDRLLVLATRVQPSALHANERTGLGQWLAGDAITLEAGYGMSASDFVGREPPILLPMSIEEAMAQSLACLKPVLQDWRALQPRSVSILPIARACQAACRFCFSEASVSSEQSASAQCLSTWEAACAQARERGAQRFVITGGGEPGLLPHAQMLALIRTGRAHFDKGVLISNGVHLARLDEADRRARLRDCAQAGLRTLAISRHHHDAAINQAIMGLDTRTERVLHSWQALQDEADLQQEYVQPAASDVHLAAKNSTSPAASGLNLRLICVLQQGGIDSREALADYLSWAAANGVRELCFKELYVSTTLASRYHAAPENSWSHAHQVPLAWLMQTLRGWGFVQMDELPWGAPVFSGAWAAADGTTLQLRIAAYTEPSVFWERSHGLARSWNLMADGTCLASLEDPGSAIALPCLEGLQEGKGTPALHDGRVEVVRVHRAASPTQQEAA